MAMEPEAAFPAPLTYLLLWALMSDYTKGRGMKSSINKTEWNERKGKPNNLPVDSLAL